MLRCSTRSQRTATKRLRNCANRSNPCSKTRRISAQRRQRDPHRVNAGRGFSFDAFALGLRFLTRRAVASKYSKACLTIRGIWARTVAGHFATRHERNALIRRAPGDRGRLRARIGACVAFSTLRSYACHVTADLVPRVLRLVHNLSFHFPPEICGQNCAMGCRRASWTVAILPRV